MSLDDLITLLLVILFVGAPLARRILGRRGSQPTGGSPDDRSDGRGRGAGEQRPDTQAERRTETPATARADRSDTPTQPERAGPSSEFERRLAEARRRVQQAMGESAATRTERQRALDEPEPLFRSQEARPQTLLGREGVREPTKKTAPLKVSKRRRKRPGSRLSAARGIVSVRPHDIMQGIVWHQILSEPVSKRAPRRKPSRGR